MYPFVAWGRDETRRRLQALLSAGLYHEAVVVSAQMFEQLIRRYLMYGLTTQGLAWDVKEECLVRIVDRCDCGGHLRSYTGAPQLAKAWRELYTKKLGKPTLPDAIAQSIGEHAWNILTSKSGVTVRSEDSPSTHCSHGLWELKQQIVDGAYSPAAKDVGCLAFWGVEALSKALDPNNGLPSIIGWDYTGRMPPFRKHLATHIALPKRSTGRRPSVVQGEYIDGMLAVRGSDLLQVKRNAYGSETRRARLCAHSTLEEPVHDMLIAFCHDTYVRPHRHASKVESFHVIQGKIEVFCFEDDGTIKSRIILGDYTSGNPFFFRSEIHDWHSLVVLGEYALIHETTSGPFNPNESEFAPWSPDPEDTVGVEQFITRLRQ